MFEEVFEVSCHVYVVLYTVIVVLLQIYTFAFSSSLLLTFNQNSMIYAAINAYSAMIPVAKVHESPCSLCMACGVMLLSVGALQNYRRKLFYISSLFICSCETMNT